MGNCQAAEAATVLIQHPGGNKVDRIYRSVSANEIMNSNPGHYVALVAAAPAARSTENGGPVKQLKLLRPDDTLVIGQVYRLISFEDVLREFAAKKCVKLGKLLKERGRLNLEPKKKQAGFIKSTSNSQSASAQEVCGVLGSSDNGSGSSNRGMGRHQGVLGSSDNGSGSSNRGMGRHQGPGGQWRPALQSISELET